MYKLYGAKNVASFTPHICLIKTEADFEFIQVDMYNKEHLGEEYLSLNPNGRIPVLIDNTVKDEPLVLYETAAISLHIADHHPQANLLPPLRSDARSHAYKWLMYFTNTIQTYLLVYYYADRYTSDSKSIPANQAAMEKHISTAFNIVAEELKDKRSFLLGDTPYLIDYFLLMLSDWAHEFKIQNGPLSHGALKNYLERVKVLPEVQAALKEEGFSPSF
ncbi:glutathione S-transferase family protein [Curvivirga aplysinae]|uniref:glutathione S-transferase family protein n=1 Tax=Curvivirga aplysinae TaxID=2529852 RepID=UPI0012BC23AD|nr:glutathione S-transferase family protein [Curvivirga aplysinae]MTI09664.1 glutathione S-transferase family protein [Curvivirga aplysinae]